MDQSVNGKVNDDYNSVISSFLGMLIFYLALFSFDIGVQRKFERKEKGSVWIPLSLYFWEVTDSSIKCNTSMSLGDCKRYKSNETADVYQYQLFNFFPE